VIGAGLARQIVDVWLATECTESRHLQRVAMFGEPGADLAISEQDIERVVSRLQEMLGPVAAAQSNGASVGEDPEAARIDHTLLKANATEEQIRNLCAEALEFNFRSVCVNPMWVSLAAGLLRGSEVLTCTVVGFPLGANEPAIKAMEARRAIRNGAREIDMVLNIGALKSGDDALVLRDIRSVVEDCEDGGAVCKVILETALLTDDEKRRASALARQARAHFVKTSTGFSTGGATVSDVALMAEAVRGAGMEVKASGGISSYDDAKAMIEAGATRLGASASIGIVREAKATSISA
jgi:deoxyribose-phosphate aldolase